MGGVFNIVNMHLYHYAGNNPVKYVDPDGNEIKNAATTLMSDVNAEATLGSSTQSINENGCVLTAYTRIANAISGRNISLIDANQTAIDMGLFTNGNELSPEAGAKLITKLVGDSNINVSYAGSISTESMAEYGGSLVLLEMNYKELYVTGRLTTNNSDNTKTYGHTLNIDSSSVVTDPSVPGGIDIKVNDTSGVRSKIQNDSRNNKLDRIDVFQVNRERIEL
jgi:hypothetical protein